MSYMSLIMIGQHGIYKDSKGLPPIRYDAVRQCLKEVALFAIDHKASVHMPRIGCGLAGWQVGTYGANH